ncbi:MAG: hypothetical protein PUE12_17630 [Oscillospiraceae bacterium]|nr:hypothetical protein [Oscillospiraceae bacterium]
MKSTFFKRITTTLVAIMSIASVTMLTVNASDSPYDGNYHDKPLGVTFSGSGTNPHTKTEGKWNNTSAYICSTDYSISSTNQKYSYSVQIYGSNYSVTAGEGDTFASSYPNIRYCNYGSEPYITPGTWSYIPNWVYERSYPNAFLVLWQKKEGSANITGVWSPDSI